MTTIRHRFRKLSQRSDFPNFPVSATAPATALRGLSPSYTRVTVVAPEFDVLRHEGGILPPPSARAATRTDRGRRGRGRGCRHSRSTPEPPVSR